MKKLGILAALLLLSTAPASAWFEFGHMEAAAVAWNKLTPAARASATRLLKLNPQYPSWVMGVSDQDRDMIAFLRASLWADDIKMLPNYMDDGTSGGNTPPNTPEAWQNIGYADHFRHRYWHFIDVPFSPDGTPTTPPTVPNAQTQIPVFRATLSDAKASSDVRSYDLVWLMHLVGDVHQPLHATSRFTQAFMSGDEGGNFVKVDCTTLCPDSELHYFWDDIPGAGNTDPQAAAAAAAALPEADPKLASISDEADWISESFEAAKSSVYVSPIGTGKERYRITEKYKADALALANKRIALAGARLANLLNAALK
jgi:hypothetical protein